MNMREWLTEHKNETIHIWASLDEDAPVSDYIRLSASCCAYEARYDTGEGDILSDIVPDWEFSAQYGDTADVMGSVLLDALKESDPNSATFHTFEGRKGEWRILAELVDNDRYALAWYAPDADDPVYEFEASGIVDAMRLADSSNEELEAMAAMGHLEELTLPYGPLSQAGRLYRIDRMRARIVGEGFNLYDALSELSRTCGKFDDASYFDYELTVETPRVSDQKRYERHADRVGLVIEWYD